MNDELALTIALIAHGNAHLRDGVSRAPDMPESNSAFRFVDSIGFVEMVNPAQGERLRTLFDAIRWG